MQNSKGSLWRKWDLHFHTPSSFDYSNESITNQQIIDGLIKNEIRVVAITDHHIIDIERILDLQRLGKGKLTVLPGIELRSELGGSDTVHYIGIFPENCDLSYVWGKLENQLNLTHKDITQKGGDDRVYVPIHEASKHIHKLGGIVSIHAGKKSNSIETISNKKLFQQAIKKDLLTDGSVDILEIGKISDVNDYREIVFPQINENLPLIICSDNHKVTDYKLKENCWIKADPNFFGLKQALVEPIERIHLGEKPEKRILVSKNRTRYINSIAIKKRKDSDLEDLWFDNVSLDLNHDLIAIIGNKGMGKSALAEVLGLLGNTHSGSFSFLSSERFRNPKQNLSSHFEAVITWGNNYIPSPICLNENCDLNAPELIKFIPQGLFEDICNEISAGIDSKFNQELRKVIFSHVPNASRLNKDSLDALITHLTHEIDDAIEIFKLQLHEINTRIVDIENQLSPDYRDQLKNRLEEKRKEFETHEKIKPIIIQRPNISSVQNSQISEQIS